MKFEELAEKIREENLDVDLDLLELAYNYAKEAHKGQLRKSGEPYINHPLATAYKLAEMEMDQATIIAGLLHDVPEDTDKTLEDIKKEFGAEVASLVAGITKLGQVKYRGIERYMENLRRMFVAMAKDIRVVVIKFADRIHNLKTLSALAENKQKRIALESLEIYAPIANRLGMGEIKGELEDLAFPYIYPKEYQWLEDKVSVKRQEKQKTMKHLIKDLEKILEKNNAKYLSLHGRSKHLYSLYNKLLTYNKDISKIYDLVAIRIVVPTISNCYECLGIVHQHCRPLKARIKDYISQPKPNGYKSLHTTIFTPKGEIVEIQIRTQRMHYEAEYGIAAHWIYKEQKSDFKTKLSWVNELSKTFKEVEIEEEGSQEKFLESLKLDVFQNRIFTFTPKGDVIELPEDATPIDFAYRIHSEIGHYCAGAKINDQIVSLSAKLKSGDVVEIHIDKSKKGPNPEWSKFVKTATAKKQIKNYLRKQKTNFIDKLMRRDVKG